MGLSASWFLKAKKLNAFPSYRCLITDRMLILGSSLTSLQLVGMPAEVSFLNVPDTDLQSFTSAKVILLNPAKRILQLPVGGRGKS